MHGLSVLCLTINNVSLATFGTVSSTVWPNRPLFKVSPHRRPLLLVLAFFWHKKKRFPSKEIAVPISRRLQSFLKVYIGISSCDWVVSTLLSNVRYRNILLMCSMCSTVCFCCHVSRKNAANMFRSSFPFFFLPSNYSCCHCRPFSFNIIPPAIPHIHANIYIHTYLKTARFHRAKIHCNV